MGIWLVNTKCWPFSMVRVVAAILCAAACSLTLNGLCAAEKSADASVTPPSNERLDSEQLLVKRRASRLKQMPAQPQPPVADESASNPIDQFIAARWKLAPAGAKPQLCDDATFLRRVY